jgi:hypothetical protein
MTLWHSIGRGGEFLSLQNTAFVIDSDHDPHRWNKEKENRRNATKEKKAIFIFPSVHNKKYPTCERHSMYSLILGSQSNILFMS